MLPGSLLRYHEKFNGSCDTVVLNSVVHQARYALFLSVALRLLSYDLSSRILATYMLYKVLDRELNLYTPLSHRPSGNKPGTYLGFLLGLARRHPK